MFIASDEIVSAIHLQIRYDTALADEQVYRYSDRQMRLCWRLTFLALDAHAFRAGGDEHFSAGDEHD